ncbi:MAG: nucleotide-binding universal stress UspA family protein [Halobacteriales archaeon]|jgi:nucleotide-binding universal stress UspA family protein
MYESILIPTDGSSGMSSVAEQALTLAEQFGASVHVLYVVDDRAYASVPDEARHKVRETLEEDGQTATKTIAEHAVDRRLSVTREIRWGNPPGAILAYADENEVDLIVMGTHGRTGYERYLLGSVAEKVVRMAERPVMTVYVESQAEDEGGRLAIEPSAEGNPGSR